MNDRSSSGPSELRVSVIVPTFQRRELVVATLGSLRSQTLPPGTFEVIVVVDGSTDGTAERLRSISEPWLRVHEQENRGRAAALNAGARLARADILLFLDDDMRADQTMIEEHLRAHAELEAEAVMGLIAHDAGSPGTVVAEHVRRDFDRDVRELGPVFGPLPDDRRVVAAQLSIRREAFEAVGGFDEAFTRGGHFGHADDDLGIRLQASGVRIAINGRAVSRQTFVRRFDSVLRQYEEYGRADVRLGRKHAEPRPAAGRWPLPARGTRSRAIAVGTLRHPRLARRVGDAVRPVAGALHDRGRTGRLTRKLTHAMLFDHRYWLGVAEAGGGGEVGVPGPDPQLLTLAYHALTPSSGRHATTPERLLRQVDALLGDGWELVDPDEVAGWLTGTGGLPLRSLLLTFDDGYEDLATRGVEVLEELGTRGVAFVVTGAATGEERWDQAPAPLLGADGLRALAATGRFEIGAHSRTHAELTAVPDERLRPEVEGPVADLERLGLPAPRFLAYPHGDHDERVRWAAAGYLAAFTVDPGLAGPGTDRLGLPRISVLPETSPQELVRRVRALRWKAFRRRVRERLRWPRFPSRPGADAPHAAPSPTEGPASRGSR